MQYRYELRALNSTYNQKVAWGAGQGSCNIHRYTDQLNHPGSAEFSLDLYDPKALQLTKFTEVQIWKYGGTGAGTLDWWGVIVGIRVSQRGSRIVFNCQGLLWYLFRRFIGRADRTQKLLNPEFESDLTNWSAISCTAVVETTNIKTGAKAAKLTQATQGLNSRLEQSVSITSGTIGEWITLAGWAKILSSGWVGPAIEDQGLTIYRSTAAPAGQFGERRVHYDFDNIDSDTPRGVWRRYETGIWIPPSVTETVLARAMCPGTTGGIVWDSLSMTLMESISYYASDQATIFAAIIAHLQDPAYLKDNVNIGTNFAATGVLLDWHSQFAEHRNFRSIVSEFTERADGFDIGFVYNANGTTRTLTSYSPRKGTQKPVLNFTERHLAAYSYEEDGDRAVSSMTILGEGDGPDREEGGAVDSAIFGGLILEDVETAPSGADIARLDGIAAERLRVNKDPRNLYVTFDMNVKDMSSATVGDTIPGIRVRDGWVDLSGEWRIVEKSTAPHQDHIILTLNPA